MISATGYEIWKMNKDIEKIAKVEPQTVLPKKTGTGEIDTSDWKTYRNEEFGFELKYPPTWEFLKGNPPYSPLYLGFDQPALNVFFAFELKSPPLYYNDNGKLNEFHTGLSYFIVKGNISGLCKGDIYTEISPYEIQNKRGCKFEGGEAGTLWGGVILPLKENIILVIFKDYDYVHISFSEEMQKKLEFYLRQEEQIIKSLYFFRNTKD